MYDNPASVTLQPFAYILLQLGKMGQKHEVKKKRKNVGIMWQSGGVRSGAGEGGGCGWRWLVDLVLMLEQKTMRKSTFFKLGSAQALSSFKVRKTAL